MNLDALTPDQRAALLFGAGMALVGLLLALNELVKSRAKVTDTDARTRQVEVEARARALQLEAEADKVASETSSAAVKAVTEGFARKDTQVSELQRHNAELEIDVAKYKANWEASLRLLEDKNALLAERDRQLRECASVNQKANERLLAITGELESIRAQYAAEIANTIGKHLKDGEEHDK
jgi:hypothetical protein